MLNYVQNDGPKLLEKIIQAFELKIEQTLQSYNDLVRANQELVEDKKRLELLLESKDARINELAMMLEELKDTPNDHLVQTFRENESKLRARIQKLIAKLDELTLIK